MIKMEDLENQITKLSEIISSLKSSDPKLYRLYKLTLMRIQRIIEAKKDNLSIEEILKLDLNEWERKKSMEEMEEWNKKSVAEREEWLKKKFKEYNL